MLLLSKFKNKVYERTKQQSPLCGMRGNIGGNMERAKERARVNNDLKAIFSQLQDVYNTTSVASRNEYLKTLAPGSQVPEEGLIYGDENKDEVRSMISGLYDRALEILNTYKEKLVEEETAAPEENVVSAISLLSMRETTTLEEINHFLDMYGENYQAFKTIVDIANRHKIRIVETHPLVIELEELDNLIDAVKKFYFDISTLSAAISDWRIDGILQNIDEALPIEE